jgi:hypothetical protein
MKRILSSAVIGVTTLLSIPSYAQTNTFPASGNVGIGTTSPQARLHTVGNHLIETNDDNVITFSNTDNSWQYLAFKRSGTRYYWMGLDDGNDFYLTKEQVGNIVLNPTAGKVVITGNYENGNIGGRLTLNHPGKTAPGAAKDWTLYNMAGSYGNSFQIWAYDNIGCQAGGTCAAMFTIMDNGNVGIGTVNPQAKLAVNGDIVSKKVIVTLNGWADYVFHTTYRLRPLSEVEQYINQYHHLPEIPTAAEVEKNGLDVGDNQAMLLKKIEELTLYAIEQEKKINSLANENKELKLLKKEVEELKVAIKQAMK